MKKILFKNKQMIIFYKIAHLMLKIYSSKNNNYLHRILYFSLWQIPMNNKNRNLEKKMAKLMCKKNLLCNRQSLILIIIIVGYRHQSYSLKLANRWDLKVVISWLLKSLINKYKMLIWRLKKLSRITSYQFLKIKK